MHRLERPITFHMDDSSTLDLLFSLAHQQDDSETLSNFELYILQTEITVVISLR